MQYAIKDLIGEKIIVQGALDYDNRGKGISPRRLPAWTRSQIPQLMDVMVRMPSGVRLRFNTDSTSVAITFHATNLVTPPRPRRPIALTLEVNGERYAKSSNEGNQIILNSDDPTEFKLERGEPDTLLFKDLATGEKTCELWLPHNAFIELRTLTVDDQSSISLPPPDDRTRWIHYGSSISHCMEAEDPSLIWPAVAARQSKFCLQSLGFGGQCHLDQFVARTIRDSDAEVISIKAGINVINMDSMKERIFEPTLHGFLDTIRERKKSEPIFVVSAIYCPAAEHHPGPTIPDAQGKFITIPGHGEVRDGCMTLMQSRSVLERVVTVRREAGDENLYYVNGLDLFGEADADDLPDDLHPNPEGYIRMGERFAEQVLSSIK